MAWPVVVGVVGNVRHFGLASDPQPEAYVPRTQDPARGMSLVLRVNPGTAVLPSIRGALRGVDPSQPVSTPVAYPELLAGSVSQPRFFSALLAGSAGLALLLAAIGLHGLLTRVVQGRHREIGVRLALGAAPVQVLALILHGALRLVGLGIVLGSLAAWGLGRLLSGMLYGTSVVDPTVYLAATGILTTVALVGAGLPASRAAKLDPARILSRSES